MKPTNEPTLGPARQLSAEVERSERRSKSARNNSKSTTAFNRSGLSPWTIQAFGAQVALH
jgi:hypothetical protein